MVEVRFDSYSAADTVEIGKKIGVALRGGEIIAYKGGLGAGKTTMTRGIAIGMGLPDTVSSPTFAIVNEYTGGRLRLCHFDMYRITTPEALDSVGYYDYIADDTVICVEWSENTEDILDENIVICIENDPDDADHRTVTIRSERKLI
ncbi:MAG: tRNA (adenosine(37)-N6)-threonylcarbamoyltransferase complex ATPase subunit type 1 TsaE [Oscillospiraceae bacterium]|nr:tRNA (adenosine(37)-N6)-threonylcarbamoyltransferase complex ATPase subunit type 1 TsaE [Oscillospiraceae bacterium]MBQ8979906.1 tRNA (adenosine(37)-N6)-threonylcarbamoyltransferase complex ATPase subunit type 1 TsaE [Oscillospiraceae bacterium]